MPAVVDSFRQLPRDGRSGLVDGIIPAAEDILFSE